MIKRSKLITNLGIIEFVEYGDNKMLDVIYHSYDINYERKYYGSSTQRYFLPMYNHSDADPSLLIYRWSRIFI